MTENDDEYYENMIRAEKRVDPKEEIAELKKLVVRLNTKIKTGIYSIKYLLSSYLTN